MKCFCDVSDVTGNKVIILEFPDHNWFKAFRGLADRLENEF
jgi:hypothetical protein